MNPTDPAFPESDPMVGADFYAKPGMDLRTYMATAFLAAHLSQIGLHDKDEYLKNRAEVAVLQADALIERLSAK